LNTLENDVYDIQLNISDYGDNIIATSTRSKIIILTLIIVNNNYYENRVRGHIFLPFFKKAKVLIGGEGQEVLIKDIIGKIESRDNSTTISNGDLLNSSFFSNEKKNCDCCIIF